MLHALYNEDGSIYHSSKLFAGEAQIAQWQNELTERGEKFVTLEAPGLLPADKHYVHVNSLSIRERPIMKNIRVDKTRVKCDDKDVSIASGIKSGTRILVTMLDGTVILDQMAEGSTLDITLPLPCTMLVTLSKWPYQDFRYEVEGVSEL